VASIEWALAEAPAQIELALATSASRPSGPPSSARGRESGAARRAPERALPLVAAQHAPKPEQRDSDHPAARDDEIVREEHTPGRENDYDGRELIVLS